MSSASSPEVVLSCQDLVKKFGGITATSDVTLQLHKGARHALIGPNGVGKTTQINLLTGVPEPTAGSILLYGVSLVRPASTAAPSPCPASRCTLCHRSSVRPPASAGFRKSATSSSHSRSMKT